MKQRIAKLLMLTLIQGEILLILSIPNNENENSAVISSSEDTDAEFPDNIPEPIKAYLPSDHNGRKKRSTGRAVDIPAYVAEQMAHTPLSALSPQLPEIQRQIIAAHNNLRKIASPTARNMLKMVWNTEAVKTAGNWARKCKAEHSPIAERKITNFKCGENIFLSNFKVPWDVVVNSWYSEKDDFKYGYGPISDRETGHYTQVMWATSYAMGCDLAECSTGANKYVYVCHNCPAGNKGAITYPWKEGKACEDCPNSCEDNLCTNPCPHQDLYTNCVDYKDTCGSDPTMKTKCPASCLCTKGEIK